MTVRLWHLNQIWLTKRPLGAALRSRVVAWGHIPPVGNCGPALRRLVRCQGGGRSAIPKVRLQVWTLRYAPIPFTTTSNTARNIAFARDRSFGVLLPLRRWGIDQPYPVLLNEGGDQVGFLHLVRFNIRLRAER